MRCIPVLPGPAAVFTVVGMVLFLPEQGSYLSGQRSVQLYNFRTVASAAMCFYRKLFLCLHEQVAALGSLACPFQQQRLLVGICRVNSGFFPGKNVLHMPASRSMVAGAVRFHDVATDQKSYPIGSFFSENCEVKLFYR